LPSSVFPDVASFDVSFSSLCDSVLAFVSLLLPVSLLEPHPANAVAASEAASNMV
jgi:hypothetical protein